MTGNELSTREQETIKFMEDCATEVTVKSRGDKWIANSIANRKYYKNEQPPLLGLTAYIVAAGPSLKKNYEFLKDIGRLGVIICVDASFRFLMKNGVVPDYCMSVDAEGKMLTMVDGVDTSRTTLIAMASSSTELVEAWKGQKFFVRCQSGSKDLDDKLVAVARQVVVEKDLKAGDVINPLEDVKVEFAGLGASVMTGGNVTGAAHSFAMTLLHALRVVFVGADYSWIDPNEFYCGGEHTDFGHDRDQAEDIFSHPSDNGEVSTNFSMFNFKRWHEDYVCGIPHEVVNATEGGILGIDRRGKPVTGWKVMQLSEAVKKYTPR